MFHSNIVKLVLDTDFENKIKNIKTYYSKIARSLKNNFNIKISRHTISKWIKNKNNIFNNRLKKEHFIEFNKIPDFLCNRKSKLKKINLELISKYIDLYPTASRLEIRTYIYNDFKILISLSSVTNIFKKLKLTRKKIKYQIIKNLDYLKDLNIKRKEYKEYFKDKYYNKLIFIDEIGFGISNMKDKGLSKKGKSIYLPDKTKFFKNLSMIMSLNSNSIIEYDIYDKAIDSYKFFNFINKIIQKLNTNGFTFIFDNVSFHHNKETLHIIKNSNNTYIFTPPYSPNFNPIENVFGIIKNNYRNKYNNMLLSNTKFTLKESLLIIDESILEFITIHYINIDKFIFKALNYSYDNIENECYLRYK
jgi:transposase